MYINTSTHPPYCKGRNSIQVYGDGVLRYHSITISVLQRHKYSCIGTHTHTHMISGDGEAVPHKAAGIYEHLLQIICC